MTVPVAIMNSGEVQYINKTLLDRLFSFTSVMVKDVPYCNWGEHHQPVQDVSQLYCSVGTGASINRCKMSVSCTVVLELGRASTGARC
jgi:hypothetical protein